MSEKRTIYNAMRLEYITPKKDYTFVSNIIFQNESFVAEAKAIRRISSLKRRAQRIKNLMEKYHINKTYKDEITHFIKTDGFRDTDHAYDKGGLIIEIPESKKPIDYYYLRVGPNTKFKDFKEAFRLMEPFRDEKLKRNRDKIYRKRDELILSMVRNHFPWQDIHKAVLEKFKMKLSETNIRTIVSGTYDKLGVSKKDRLRVSSRKNQG